VPLTVQRHLVAGRCHRPRQPGVPLDLGAEHEEGGAHPEAGKLLEDPWRAGGARSVIEGERDVVAGSDAAQGGVGAPGNPPVVGERRPGVGKERRATGDEACGAPPHSDSSGARARAARGAVSR
jgi:hypothetical protein